MKYAQFHEYGAARDVLRIASGSLPVPGPGDLLVRVHASSVNPIDCAVRRGYGKDYFEAKGMSRLPMCPGRDAAGEIVSVGAGITQFKAGDAVYAATLGGGNAEYAIIPESQVSAKPESLDFVRAAAIPYSALTAWSALVGSAGLTPENAPHKRVIIPRAAGGVGSLAVQLVKAWGGYVAAICSTRNHALVQSLGADEIIDYTQLDPRTHLREFDIAFDTAPDTEAMLLGALKIGAGAQYVSIVSPRLRLIDQYGLQDGLRRGDDLFDAKQAAQRELGRSYHWAFTQPNVAALRIISDMVDAGKIRPIVDRTYPLDQIVEAHAYCESGRASGRIVITMEPNP
jgi:NADPH:quinone reductase-like Zn-dependent oxidoreductase